MFEFEKYDAIRRESREEGRKEGIREGLAEVRRETITKIVKVFRDKSFTEEEIRKTLADIYPGDEGMISEIMENRQ